MPHDASLESLYRDHIDRLGRDVGAAIESAGYAALVIHSGTPVRKLQVDDQYWPHQPTPAFTHWVPLPEPGCALVIRPGHKPELVRPVSSDFWHGEPPAPPEHVLGSVDVVEALPEGIGECLPTGRLAFLGDDVAAAARWGITSADDHNPPSLVAALDAIRARKSAYERACIAEANRIAARGHRAVAEIFLTGPASELDVHLAYLRATGQDDPDTPYKNIVAIGEHAAILHHVHYGHGRVGGDTSLLVDAGATYCGYASDITRTTVRGRGELASEFVALIEGMDTLQRELCDEITVGSSFEALHERAHEKLAPLLRDAGLAHGSDEELVATGVTRAFFPHGLGHSLGIQVHDVGCRPRPPSERNPFLRNTSDIAPGHVLTIEPGCYFIPHLLDPLRSEPAGSAIDWAQVARLRPLGGVRIEDNVAVLEDGVVNLTREGWRGGASSVQLAASGDRA